MTITVYGVPRTVSAGGGYALLDVLCDDLGLSGPRFGCGLSQCGACTVLIGTSVEAHQAGLDRVIQAGAKPVSWVALAVELQRDWARLETVQEVVDIVLTERLLKEQ
jgi:aerobic-type carbon monoxide dehydrogenase small subunit (CoxS/CutS family)